jgi:hypothetical protein
VGSWDTGPYVTNGMKWEVNVTFYDEGGAPFVVLTGWDPTKGSMLHDGDHGPYKLLANNRIAFLSADAPVLTTVYSYKLAGDKLSLTWIHNDPNGPPGDKGGPFATIHLSRG